MYRVERDGQVAALKAESNQVEGGSAIKLEVSRCNSLIPRIQMAVLMMLNKITEAKSTMDKSGKGGHKVPHVPYIYHAAKRRKFCYMIVTMLGKNLRSLKTWKEGSSTLTPSTWARLGLQSLYALKLVHDVGFVHRDIKPANFMMGRDDDMERGRLVHILDFGLAR